MPSHISPCATMFQPASVTEATIKPHLCLFTGCDNGYIVDLLPILLYTQVKKRLLYMSFFDSMIQEG